MIRKQPCALIERGDKRRTKSPVAICALLTFSTAAWAEGTNVFPYFGAGLTRYTFKEVPSEDRDTIALYRVGLRATNKNVFAQIELVKSGTGEDDRLTVDTSQGITTFSQADLEYTSASVRLGYQFTENWSAYLGYIDTEIEIETKFDIRFPGALTILSEVERRFDYDGPQVGVSYTQPLRDGKLTATVEWSELDATREGRLRTFGSPVDDPVRFSLDGDGVAVNLGWHAPLMDDWVYGIALSWHKFQFDGTGFSPTHDLDAQESETSLMFSVGVPIL